MSGKRRPGAGRPDVERDVKDEVSFHIEALVRDLVREGMDAGAAREEALRRFGSVSRVEDRLRRIGQRRERRRRASALLLDVREDIRFALRNLRRHPLFALLMVIILALGIAVNAAVFRVVDGALLRALPFPEGARLVRVFAGESLDERFSISFPEYRDWSSRVNIAQATTAFYGVRRVLIRPDAEPESVPIRIIDGDIMRVLGLAPVIGRGITREDVTRGERVVMLDETVWHSRYGGRQSVLGDVLSFAGEPYTVIGVMPAEARILAQSDAVFAWIPLVEEDWMVRSTHFLGVVARLASDVTPLAAESRADVVEQALIDEGTTDHGMVMLGLREQIVAQSRPVLLVLAGAVVFVLLIVCANLTNLFHAHALGRTREFAVRASLGAGRGRLIRQVVTEGVVVGIAGGAAGLLFARLLGGVVAAATGEAALLARSAWGDVRVAGFTLLVALLAGSVIATWPALRAGRSGLGESLGSGTRTVGDRHAWRRRRWIVAAEVALCVTLLAGAGLMIRSVVHLLDQDPGFYADSLLTFGISLPSNRYDDARIVRFHDDLREALLGVPRIVEAGATSHLPLGGSDTNGNFHIPGREFPDDQQPQTMKRIVTPGYFEAMRVPLVAGRLPAEHDRAGAADVVVISQALADRYWPNGNAVGQRVLFSWGPEGDQEIIGVVGDIRHNGLDTEPVGMMYRTQQHFPFAGMTVVARVTGDPMSVIPQVRAAVRAIDPDVPLTNVRSMRSVLRASIGDRRTLMRLLSGFAALALLLAALGVYAVAAQSVQQRRREIGVRTAVGARAADILSLVVGQELVPVAIGVVLGIAGALAATRLLQASLFGVASNDPFTLAAAAALIVLAALLAIVQPARQAAGVQPATVLRDG